MEYPLVSAIVLSYNQAQFAIECLEGVNARNYPDLELIVNDDASRDNSVEVIRGWLDGGGLPYQLIKSPKNRGICRSMNNALPPLRRQGGGRRNRLLARGARGAVVGCGLRRFAGSANTLVRQTMAGMEISANLLPIVGRFKQAEKSRFVFENPSKIRFLAV